MQTKDVVIVSACRTAIGKFQGQFKDVSARELAITAGKEAIRRAGIDITPSTRSSWVSAIPACRVLCPHVRFPCGSVCPSRAAP